MKAWMRARNEQATRHHAQALEELRERAAGLAREYENGLHDDTRAGLRRLCDWLDEQAAKIDGRSEGSKVSLTRLRLLGLQLEKVLEQLYLNPQGQGQAQLLSRLDELLTGQKRRELYDDMISCLKELATTCVEKGLGRQAALYNDMSTRLETRLECGHIDIHNDEQRTKDEALFQEFQEKLEALKK